ncbi:carbon-nitrogen hydrolase family protein [Streptomyces sp. FZ201]|uniref:carbon-nitrogen hydrolase family protein n=1 Tax=Streptomyces sp. FZ201 TaxID=3057122 RepID=UPI0021C09712|nr:carbon-nitrogen hydrolase family protein [Streptomyces sp. FZ201]
MSVLRIAVAQTPARSLDITGNARTAAANAIQAAQAGAGLVVLPELHLCAYDLPQLARHTHAATVHADEDRTVTDVRLSPLARAATDHGITVLMGAAVRHPDGSLTNSLLAIDPTGGITVPYDKQHLWHDEEAALFTAGTRPGELTVHGRRLGLGVCYDMSFPEHARAAAVSGAEALLYPAAFATGTEHRAAIYLKARALENTVYTVFANALGGPAHRPCAGAAAVYAPDGSTEAEAEAEGDTILYADLTPRIITDTRVHLRMLGEYRASLPTGRPRNSESFE